MSISILTFNFLSYSATSIYNANLRSFIIGEIAEFVPSRIEDIKSGQADIIYTDLGLNYASTLGNMLQVFLSIGVQKGVMRG